MDSPQQPAQGNVFGTIALIALGVTFGIITCLAIIFWQQHRQPESAQAAQIRSIASSVQQSEQEMVSPSLSEAWTTERTYTVKPIIEETQPEMGRTASGYPIGSPHKSIDWGAEQYTPTDPACVIGRNGLQGNPPVDPPSSKGRAYGYQ